MWRGSSVFAIAAAAFTAVGGNAPGSAKAVASCRAPQLESSLVLQGATGHLLGPLRVRNRGLMCMLQGRPRLELRGNDGKLIPIRRYSSPPRWRLVSPRRGPPGWPAVRLRRAEHAAAWVTVSNWCRRTGERVRFRFGLSGRTGSVTETVRIRVRCESAEAPVSVGVGPFEPIRR